MSPSAPGRTAALAAAGTTAFGAATPKSIQQGTLDGIKTAKAPENRAKRIKDVTDNATDGQRPTPFRR